MNKECRDELAKIKKQTYKLILHNLLEKEERAHRMVKRIQFKYLTCEEDRNHMNKVEAKKVIAIIKVAKKVGERAGQLRLKELKKAGPRWNVINERQNKVVGQMLDVCGFAHLSVPGRGRIVRAFKKIGIFDLRIDCYVVTDALKIWKGYRSGYALSIISTGRQEMSVNEAAVRAASEFLNENHLECAWSSRID